MTSAFSWQSSINICPASFRILRPNLPVTPGVFWLPTFAFQSPLMKRTFFWVLVLEGLVLIAKANKSESHSVVSDCLQPHGLYSPWNSPGRNTGGGSLSLLQVIIPTQGSKPGVPHCRWIRILYSWATREAHKASGSHLIEGGIRPQGCFVETWLNEIKLLPRECYQREIVID